MEHAEKVFVEIAEQCEDCVDMWDALRSLETHNEITEEEYDYIIEHWNSMLKKHNL